MNKYSLRFNFLIACCILSVSGQSYDEDRSENSPGQGRQEDNGNEQQATTKAPVPVTSATIPPVTSTIDPVHVQGQVNNILNNVNSFNISGIVDSSLGIRNNTPVRNLVNSIISLVFCNVFFAPLNTAGCGQKVKKSLDISPEYDYVVYRIPRSVESRDWVRKVRGF